MIMQRRFIIKMMVAAAFNAATPAGAADKALEKASQKTPALAPPGELRRPNAEGALSSNASAVSPSRAATMVVQAPNE